ncbi:unnamed protein product [Ascophyllum nodosum]
MDVPAGVTQEEGHTGFFIHLLSATITFLFLGWYANVRIGWGNFKIPKALQVILVGVILGWITGLNKSSDVKDTADLVKW